MKKFLTLLLACGLYMAGYAQFTSTVSVDANGRTYLVNQAIPGATEDAQGINYILLHKNYNGTLMEEHLVMGKITGIRGNPGAYNRKFTVEVNTSTAYSQTMGSILSYTEPTRLVTLTCNGQSWLALEIANIASMSNFSFTGYVRNAELNIVYDQSVSNVQEFNNLTPINIQGPVGIGLNVAPGEKLHVNGGAVKVSKNATPFSGNFDAIKGIWMEGTSEYAELALGYSCYGGGAAAIGFSRGGSWDTYIRFFTNPGNNTGTHNMKERMRIDADGNVAIGTDITTNYKLGVNGTIGAQKVKVTQTGWADFVFHKDYSLPTLAELEAYIHSNQHLPGIPSEEEVKKDGIDLGDMDARLLQKIEELTLYMIELKKENEAMKARLNKLEKSGS